ncbi:MAG: 30S ribosome-binding factor RbfA [Rhodospirillaceae bacterium]|jgi:ribosome-binding factor A|nr:30S ribosome-binding factor RbfA [Rhodospirillaceae bacterium]MBT4115790.1 30S ribosome-binding factor RbfA [Rhodospirillaceae bacterium]MBT4718885.1 30S ribosome-binding factor RbfA [Rhodospirillaceae bacterium]MBT5181457.1 30S ribosome-binding factor RbfA [Rhodospirillaceae bacterium]MBT5839421.1 30S ribosome-binding factor RbfA [Rhodospirillaceae bacterium]
MSRSKAPSQRQLRVGEQVRHAIASVIERGELRDPDLDGVPVTVTEVRLSPDLRKASIFVVPLGGGDTESILPPLSRAAPFLRHRVSEMVQLKYAPELVFEADKTFDYADRIDAVLQSVGLGGSEIAGAAEDEEHGP